ncbi:glycosyltransferase family protein [Paracraurococcus lichenis]|uniref:Glycosyltransferase n=1 Tax=Paracraurococcus lichenis TaxID=3064888 RepID=A0ABT9DSH2_9PROT|nr:glycosyltransferase [Paracraurococcus sp. LOR1-02]MDO9706833.1 glycosyltransferase [Paracraurococcus sp. LOR1-02]
MTRAPRLLIVSPAPSHPADQGNSARIQVMGAALMARGIACDFLYYATEGCAPAQREAMAGFWHALHVMPPVPTGRMGFPGVWALDDWCDESLCEQVAALHRRAGYDAVLVNYVWMSRVLEAVPGTFRLIDTHDLFGDRHLVARAAGIDPSWFFTTVAEEGRGLARADLVLAIQSEEAEILRSRGPAPVMTLGHMPPLRFLEPRAAGAVRAPFGYFGSANPWNLASVRALDALLTGEADLPWLLAGRILQRRDLVLHSAPQRLPQVPEPDTFYDAVDCVLNPMVPATGLKIKTVEALAFGRPVLGTRHAFTGLPAEHPGHCATGAEEMVGLMREWRRSAAFRADLAEASRLMAIRYAADLAAQQDALAERLRAAV